MIDEQHCEVVMIRRSRLAQLESALDTSYGKSLRVVLYTECDYVEKTETDDTLRCDETLMEEYDLQVLPLSHIMNEEYSNYGRCAIACFVLFCFVLFYFILFYFILFCYWIIDSSY